MHVTFERIIDGEGSVILPFPIENLGGYKEVAIVDVFIDTTICEVTSDVFIDDTPAEKGELFPKNEIKKLLKTKENHKYFKINKLEGIDRIDFRLNELDCRENIVGGSLCSSLLKYHVTEDSDFIKINSNSPQYKKLRNGIFNSLTIKMVDSSGEQIRDKMSAHITLDIK